MTLSAQTPKQPFFTLDDFLAIPEHERWHEFIDGRIVERARPKSDHGYAQAKFGVLLDEYEGPVGQGRRGGWWFVVDTEVDCPPARRRFRPDVMGWRRDSLPGPPAAVESHRPDWVCEIISPEKRSYDTVEKRTYYSEAGIPHYWLLDYERGTLSALGLSGGRYLGLGEGARGDSVRLPPFAGVEIAVSRLLLR